MGGIAPGAPSEGQRTPEPAFLAVLGLMALIAVAVGAVGSVGLMLQAGHPPLFLRILFVCWVAFPFAALAFAHAMSKQWSVVTRAALYSVMLTITLATLATYAAVAFGPTPRKTPYFVLVPPAASLLMAVVVPTAALVSGKRSRRDHR